MSTQLSLIEEAKPIRLDLGCGVNKRKDGEWIGVDILDLPGVDVMLNIGTVRWPWTDNTVEEAHCSHFIEHLTNLNDRWERVHFFNELFRVLRPGGKATLIFPHWASTRYYGDPTHKEPFSEMGFYYLSREWRLGNAEKGLAPNAPHSDIQHNPNGYACDFVATWGYNLHQSLQSRNTEFQQFALQWYREAAQDILATLVKP